MQTSALEELKEEDEDSCEAVEDGLSDVAGLDEFGLSEVGSSGSSGPSDPSVPGTITGIQPGQGK